MFIDQAEITVRAGDGGRGAATFRREKYIPKGGPDGGNGGRGGDVVFFGDTGKNTLYDFRGRPDWAATPGENGRAKQQSGLAGPDLVINVPPGTLVYNADTGELMADIGVGQRAIIAKGGRGGWGNEHYKTSTNQAPKAAEAGEQGQRFDLRLELKLIADVGIIGLPNAGKSTLLAAVTSARPKIADYPFTTLTPQLGIAALDAERRIVLADIPGLIEGASGGAGLGHEFLRHVERTRVLIHLIDISAEEPSPADNYRLIREELAKYSPLLAEKQELIILNKTDLLTEAQAKSALSAFRKELRLGRGDEVLTISAATQRGTKDMLDKMWTMLRAKVNTWKSADAGTPA